ncbi:MAG TPA: hypothetical protein DDX51_02895 [Clostridiales bacterium]|nr:hypothetical protein [Clostridiales bacterium]
MAVTLKQIAELAGVSRGTVDRALYNRGRINPEVAERIRSIAKELGYQPNRAGKALAMAKHPIKIGVIAQATETPFMHLLQAGIEDARKEVSNFGAEVLMRSMIGLDIDLQLKLIDELVEEGINGLAIAPADDVRMRNRINELVDSGIPVVTFNADIDDTRRLCFVGQNSELAGRACAALLSAIIGNKGLVLPISGHQYNHSHTLRIKGFCSEMENCFPEVKLLPSVFCQDDDTLTQQLTEQTLRDHPDLTAIYVAAGGQSGVCRGLARLGCTGSVRVICYDLIPNNIKNLLNSRIDFLIDQDAHTQGYQPIMILFDYLFAGTKPESKYFYTDIAIKNKYNI